MHNNHHFLVNSKEGDSFSFFCLFLIIGLRRIIHFDILLTNSHTCQLTKFDNVSIIKRLRCVKEGTFKMCKINKYLCLCPVFILFYLFIFEWGGHRNEPKGGTAEKAWEPLV